jgi:surface protein
MMFYGDTVFNQTIRNWNVSNVTNMQYMFNYATSFNQNINNWLPNIVGKPSEFDDSSGFSGKTALQPQWK